MLSKKVTLRTLVGREAWQFQSVTTYLNKENTRLEGSISSQTTVVLVGLVFSANSLALALKVRGVTPLSLGPALAHYRKTGALVTISEVSICAYSWDKCGVLFGCGGAKTIGSLISIIPV